MSLYINKAQLLSDYVFYNIYQFAIFVIIQIK